MADHWKSIASQLGAPGMDAPEPIEEVAETAENDSTSENSQGSESAVAAEQAPSVVPEALGSSVVDAPADEKLEQTKKPEVVSESEAPVSKSTSDEGAKAPPKKKRRSSWESLAAMFNIPVDRSEEADVEPQESPEEPAAEVVPEASVVDSAAEDLPFFKPEPTKDANSALEEMFGEAPKDESTWEAKPRVVDDVSWEVEDDAKSSSSRGSSDNEEEEEVADARRGRRRRRRGRRGGQSSDSTSQDQVSKSSDDAETLPDQEPLPETSQAEQEPEQIGGWGKSRKNRGRRSTELSEERSDNRDGSESPRDREERPRRSRSNEDRPREDLSKPARASRGQRDEGRSRGRGRGGRGREERKGDDREIQANVVSAADWDEPESFETDTSDPPQDSERRSSRRRRRGRRTPEAEDDQARREPKDDRSEMDGARARAGSSDVEAAGDAEATDESIEKPGRRRRRRRPDTRGERNDRTTVQDDDVSQDDDDMSSESKHRNIPTWSDSLESIIVANTENHKRNENRGGQRGRSRGRR